MALTNVVTDVENPAGVRFKSVKVTFDSSYLTGGELVAPADWGFKSAIDGAVFGPAVNTTNSVVVAYNPVAGTLKAYGRASAVTTDIPLVEVASTTDLSTYIFYGVAWGR